MAFGRRLSASGLFKEAHASVSPCAPYRAGTVLVQLTMPMCQGTNS
jgi:hypothetical protein